eukprot:8177654-Ditylum_brightwellii.AAC.1
MKWKKVSSAGQKLPDNWQEKRKKIIERVERRQSARYDDTLKRHFKGTKDERICNTDHVPTWVEPVGNMT